MIRNTVQSTPPTPRLKEPQPSQAAVPSSLRCLMSSGWWRISKPAETWHLTSGWKLLSSQWLAHPRTTPYYRRDGQTRWFPI